MKQYLLSVYQPDGEPPAAPVLEKIMRDVRAVRDEMKAAGAWVFSAGLHAPSASTVVRVQDGEALITDGPFCGGQGVHRWLRDHPRTGSRRSARLGAQARCCFDAADRSAAGSGRR